MIIAKRLIPLAVLGALLGIAPHTVVPACSSHGHGGMPCQLTAGVASAIGFAVLAGAVLSAFQGIRFAKGAALMAGLTGLLAPLVSRKLVGLCRMEAMECRTGLGPAVDVIAILILIAAGGALVWPDKSRKGEP